MIFTFSFIKNRVAQRSMQSMRDYCRKISAAKCTSDRRGAHHHRTSEPDLLHMRASHSTASHAHSHRRTHIHLKHAVTHTDFCGNVRTRARTVNRLHLCPGSRTIRATTTLTFGKRNANENDLRPNWQSASSSVTHTRCVCTFLALSLSLPLVFSPTHEHARTSTKFRTVLRNCAYRWTLAKSPKDQPGWET